ncbi:MAG: hypothetical protein AAGK14_06025 [Verrucomicrobiota bacterium]
MDPDRLSPEHAQAQLQAIRHLMARATHYRALSAPTALVAGLLSVFAAYLCWRTAESTLLLPPMMFVWLWLVVLVIVWVLNAYFLWESARQRREPLFSPSFRLAMSSFLPPLVTGGVLTWWVLQTPDILAIVLVWNVCYGLALLGTQAYAPRSLYVLGWAFLLTGLLLTLPYALVPYYAVWFERIATIAMAVSFGGYHLAYAVIAWRSTAELFPRDAARSPKRYHASSVGDDLP